MISEGRGRVAPAPVEIIIPAPLVARYRALAERRDSLRRYARREDDWGKGAAGNPTLVGLMGEKAACMLLSRRLPVSLDVDESDRPDGDGGVDIQLSGVLIQVKTRRRRGAVLVRRIDDYGRLIPVGCDVLVSATWGDDSSPVVTVDGWVGREALLGMPLQLGRFGRHQNLEVEDSRLLPIGALVLRLGMEMEAGY